MFDLSLVLSTIEYHNRTWLDLLMALKNDTKKILLSQAIKQRLLKSRNIPERDNQPQEEEKAAILLGTQHLAGQDQTTKKGFLSRMRKDQMCIRDSCNYIFPSLVGHVINPFVDKLLYLGIIPWINKYTQEPKHYDHLSITSWAQHSFNPPWHGCHKSLVDGRRQIIPNV
ncbi:UNVERIFIED_CONTAM: hypothetical protein NCL1_13671 [Trichonephila clavipes]